MTMPLSSTPTSPDVSTGASPEVTGIEWVIDAIDCEPSKLRNQAWMRSLCDQVIADLQLHVVGDPLFHQFPDPGGVTGLYLLSESHLACHTYPEFSLATFNLYCCRERPPWSWADQLVRWLEAGDVDVRQFPRGKRGAR